MPWRPQFQMIGPIIQIQPETADNIDGDEIVRDLPDMFNTPHKWIMAIDRRDAKRAQRPRSRKPAPCYRAVSRRGYRPHGRSGACSYSRGQCGCRTGCSGACVTAEIVRFRAPKATRLELIRDYFDRIHPAAVCPVSC